MRCRTGPASPEIQLRAHSNTPHAGSPPRALTLTRLMTLALAVLLTVNVSGCGSASISESWGEGDWQIETIVSRHSVTLGESFEVSCRIVDPRGGRTDLETTFDIEPPSFTKEENTITPSETGKYEVACRTTDGRVVDEHPEEVVVSAKPPPVNVVTRLPADEIPTCWTGSVRCDVLSPSGVRLDLPTSVTISPDEGITLEGHTLTTEEEGTFVVTCALEDGRYPDLDPPELTVVGGIPTLVVTTLTPDTVMPGEPAAVSCTVLDSCGAELDLPTVIEVAPGVTLDERIVSSEESGDYTVTCLLADEDKFITDTESATLSVLRKATQVVLEADPWRESYDVGAFVSVTATAYDEDGVEVEYADITIEVPNGVSRRSDERYMLNNEGMFTFRAYLTEEPAIDDELTLLVDSGPPELVIFSPERGATFDGEPYIPISGHVSDISGVDQLEVNGVEIPVEADGHFSYQWPADFGLNVLWFEAADTLGKTVRISRGVYYSTDWVPMDPPDMEVARLLDSVMLFLGQDGLDSGVREPPHIRDLATLVEVLLSGIDLPGLIGADQTPMPLFSTVFENVVDYSFTVAGIQFGLFGDLGIEVAIEEIYIGDFKASGQFRHGGVDFALGIAGDDPGEPGMWLLLSMRMTFDVTLGYRRPLTGERVGFVLDPPPSLYAESAAFVHGIFFEIGIDADMPRGGELDVAVSDIRITVEEIDLVLLHELILDLGGFELPFIGYVDLPEVPLTDLVEGLDEIVTDALLDPLIQWLFDTLADLISPPLSAALTGLVGEIVDLLALDIELPLPQLPGTAAPVVLQFSLAPSSLHMDPLGGTFGLGAGMLSDKGVSRDPHGSILRDGCMGIDDLEMEFNPATPMQAGFLFDFVNQVFFSLWWGGGINLELDLDALGGIGGVGDIADGTVTLDFLLPPIMTDCTPEGLTELQLGDLFIEMDASAFIFSGTLSAWVSARMEAEITVDNDTLGVRINRTPVIDLEIVEASGAMAMFAGMLPGLLRDTLIPMLVDGIASALGAIPIPAIDLDGIIPGVPPGTSLQLGDLHVETRQGYLLLGGALQ